MKLDNKQIEQICRRFDTGKVSVKLLSKQFQVTPKRIKQILQTYKETGEYPKLKNVGRPKESMDPSTKQIIKDAYLAHQRNASDLSKVLRKHYGISVSKNKIHLVLREFGFASRNMKKSKPRKTVRYERKHSNSLWHVDWHYLNHAKGYLVGIIDDASRKVYYEIHPCMGIANTIKAMENAFKYFNAKPEQLISDNGTEFRQLLFNKRGEVNHEFQKFCERHRIEQLFTRPSRPQTNGKIERWFGTYEQKRPVFNSEEEFLHWYNNTMHGSLGWRYDDVETPNEAYMRKMREEDIFAQLQQKIFN